MDNYWKIAALVGTIVFLVSGFLPVFSNSQGLVNEYQYVGSEDWANGLANYPVYTLGFLLLLILWPIALILSIVSIFKRKTALVAGIVGIVSWAGAAMYDSAYPSGSLPYGSGIFVGFAGAIIMLVAYYLKPKPGTVQVAPPQVSAPPPPPQPQATTPPCPTCRQPLTYVQQYGRWYCYNCGKYA